MCLSQCCSHLVEAARPVYKGANLRRPSVHSHHRRANHAAVRPVIYFYGEKIDVHGKSWHDWHGNYEQMWQTLAVMSISSNLTRAFMHLHSSAFNHVRTRQNVAYQRLI